MVSYFFNREGGGGDVLSTVLPCLGDISLVVIQAAHIPGKKNLLADDCQRGQLGYQITEWSLIKRELVNKFSTPNIDV